MNYTLRISCLKRSLDAILMTPHMFFDRATYCRVEGGQQKGGQATTIF